MGDTAIGVPIREPSRHVLFVDASSTGIAGRKTSFGTRTTSPLSFILRRWVSWRLPRRDSHPRSPRTEPSVATRPEVLVFHPIRPLTWPSHRSYQTSRPRFSARTRSLLHGRENLQLPIFLPPFPSSIFDEISRVLARRVFVVGMKFRLFVSFRGEKSRLLIFPDEISLRGVSFFEEIGTLIWIFWEERGRI